MSELIEEVDADGTVVRVVTRAEMRADRLRHRAVFIAVIGSDDRLLVHRRADDKDLWPGYWDLAAGGVVGAGEAWDDAAARELGEELGVSGTLEALGGATFDHPDALVVGHIYLVRHDGPFHFDDGEVTEARFVTPSELGKLRAAHPFCPDSIALVLPRLDPRWTA